MQYLQYLTKMLRQYLNCNEILEIFLTSFCNILCYVGRVFDDADYESGLNFLLNGGSNTLTMNLCEINSWYHGLLIRVLNSEIRRNGSNMMERYNKNK